MSYLLMYNVVPLLFCVLHTYMLDLIQNSYFSLVIVFVTQNLSLRLNIYLVEE